MDETEPRGPLRRCLVTGAVGPKTALIRFVVGPDGVLVPDIRGRLPGRGLWVSARRAVLDEAIRKRQFARAARAGVTVPADLSVLVERLLVRQVQDALGLAYKAGAVKAGFAKAEAALRSGQAIALLEALHAGPHGGEKLRRAAQATGIPVLHVLTGAEMGLALGRENMVHAALGAERLAHRLIEEARRLAGFRNAEACALSVSDVRSPSPVPESKSAPESES